MTNPPRGAEALLSALGAEHTYRDAVLGDLAEEFNGHAQRDGELAARWWYYAEALRSAPHFLRNWASRATWRDARRIGNAVLLAYVGILIVGILVGGVAIGIRNEFGIGVNVKHLTGPTIAFVLGLGAMGSIAAGYFASAMDHETPMISALAMALLWSAVDAVAYVFAPERAAWQSVVPLIPLIGATLGGMLRSQRAVFLRE